MTDLENSYVRTLQMGSHDMWLTPPVRFLFTHLWRTWLRVFWLDMVWRWRTRIWCPETVSE